SSSSTSCARGQSRGDHARTHLRHRQPPAHGPEHLLLLPERGVARGQRLRRCGGGDAHRVHDHSRWRRTEPHRRSGDATRRRYPTAMIARRRHHRVATLLACVASLLIACGDESADEPEDVAETASGRTSLERQRGEVVATVDGNPITRAQLNAAAARMPEKGPEEVLANLI